MFQILNKQQNLTQNPQISPTSSSPLTPSSNRNYTEDYIDNSSLEKNFSQLRSRSESPANTQKRGRDAKKLSFKLLLLEFESALVAILCLDKR